MNSNDKLSQSVYASVGKMLTRYEFDGDRSSLIKRETLELPFNVQYAWAHPTQPFLYLACSNGSPSEVGSAHCLVSLVLNGQSGVMSRMGEPVGLAARAVHMTLDQKGQFILVAYNKPSRVSVHRLLANGLIGEEVEQTQTLDTGIYAHQVRVSLSNKSVIVVARGNNAKENQPEDPGSLRVFSFSESGQLKTSSTVAPKQGYGFGPRHLDFHPSKPWVYVSLERQNGLHMYLANEMGDQVADQPSYVKPTLSEEPGSRPRQRSGTVHVHPNGRSVYVANRASGLDSEQMYVGGENNIAVYRIDAISGEPTIIQHMDTRGVVARTFALDKTGTLLLAANSQTIRVKKDGQQTLIPASLALFHVLNDGSLAYVGKTDVPVGEEVLFWMGIA